MANGGVWGSAPVMGAGAGPCRGVEQGAEPPTTNRLQYVYVQRQTLSEQGQRSTVLPFVAFLPVWSIDPGHSCQGLPARVHPGSVLSLDWSWFIKWTYSLLSSREKRDVFLDLKSTLW